MLLAQARWQSTPAATSCSKADIGLGGLTLRPNRPQHPQGQSQRQAIVAAIRSAP